MLRSPRVLTTRRVAAYGRVVLPASRRRRIARRAAHAVATTGVAAVAGVIADSVVAWRTPDVYSVDRDVRETLVSGLIQTIIMYYLI
jgi:hypothetical protein